MTQVVNGDRYFTLSFRFFRLIGDYHIQHGPSFPKPIDVLISALTGQITSREKDRTATQEHLDLPADVSNGLPPNLLMDLLPSTPETKLSFVAPTAKPRLIHVTIKPAGEIPSRLGERTGRLSTTLSMSNSAALRE